MCTCTSASLRRANLKKLLVKRVFAPIRIKVKSFSVRRFVLTKTCWCQSQRREVKFDAALSHQLFFIANAISDNLRCAASPRVSTWLFCAVGQPSTSVTEAEGSCSVAVDVLMISREIKCSLSASSCVHVFMRVQNACLGSFGYKIQASEPCTGIVGQPQKISSYPTGQGAALRTNLPSISLSDWQPGHLSQDRNL